MAKKRCFVVMGFEIKTAPEDNRKLDLNKTYDYLIKPAVEAAGLEPIRADKTYNSGSISREMFEHLLDADVVVGDLSTANTNAYYEVGIRHALRPATTVLIAENNHKIPFDLKDITVLKYEHLGSDIGASTVESFVPKLTRQIQEALRNGEERADSPVYTFLHDLEPPTLQAALAARAAGAGGVEAVDVAAADIAAGDVAAGDAAAGDGPDSTNLGLLVERAERAIADEDFGTAAQYFKAAEAVDPGNVYLLQRWTLARYKSKHPDEPTALTEARDILARLEPATSTDPETLGLWGAIHKRLWEHDDDRAALQAAIASYERGFYMKLDYYNGINFAYLLNVRCNLTGGPGGVADFVGAQRVRRQVIEICNELRAQPSFEDRGEERYWIAATLQEAWAGLGDAEKAAEAKALARQYAEQTWMTESTESQVTKLEQLIAGAPGAVKAVVTGSP